MSLLGAFAFSLIGVSVYAQQGQSGAPAAPAQAASPGTQPRTPDSAPAGNNLLCQIEDAVTALVREARPAVVSVEGFSTVFRLSLSEPPDEIEIGDLNDMMHNLPPDQRAEYQKVIREAQALHQKALKQSQAQGQFLFRARTTGSGFLLPNGFVVTTAEVTEGMRDPVVVMADGKRLQVEWISPDVASNVCVLKVSGVAPTVGLRLADSDRVQPGSFAITIGNQAGFADTVSLGLISGVGRCGQSDARQYHNLLQFQGPVGNNSSGGPVLNARGEVIGMIVAAPAGGLGNPAAGANGSRARPDRKFHIGKKGPPNTPKENDASEGQNTRNTSDTTRGSGNAVFQAGKPTNVFMFNAISNTGFALPSNELKRVTAALVKQGGKQLPERTGWFGVQLGEPGMKGLQQGAVIDGIYTNSPADRAGLQLGDVVISVDGTPIRIAGELRELSQQSLAGQVLRLEVRRGEATLTLILTVAPRPTNEEIKKTPLREHHAQTGFLSPPLCSTMG